jgi:hypothetical protein
MFPPVPFSWFLIMAHFFEFVKSFLKEFCLRRVRTFGTNANGHLSLVIGKKRKIIEFI